MEFDPVWTLIGGPNESGKSTLAEAIYHGLFLRSRRGGQDRERMVSRHGGDPEVMLRFAVGDRVFELQKRFGGATRGTTSLQEEGGEAWQNEEAEEMLHRLLGIETGESKHKPTEAWAHLWAWQGESGLDPAGFASARRTELMQRLQAQPDAAALMQSARDAQVGEAVRAEVETIFGKLKKARKGSALGQAMEAEQEAILSRETAEHRWQQLEEATEQATRAEAALAECHAQLPQLEARYAEARQRLERWQTLRLQLSREKAEWEKHRAVQEDWVAKDRRIRELERVVHELREKLAPAESQLREQEEQVKGATVAREEAERAFSQIRTRAREARQAATRAEQERRLIELEQRLAEGRERAKTAADRKASLESVRAELKQLPPLDEAGLEELVQWRNEMLLRRTALDSMATELEWLEGKLPVEVDGRPLKQVEPELITGQVELRIGEKTRLRLTPGGGHSLADARRAFEEAELGLEEGLKALGLGTVEEAQALRARRRQWEEQEGRLTAVLQAEGSREAEVAELEKQYAAACQAFETLVGEAWQSCDDPEARQAVHQAAIAARQTVEQEETEADATVKQKREAVEMAERKGETLRQRHREDQERLHRESTALDLLRKEFGESATREAGLKERAVMCETAAEKMRGTEQEMAELGSEALPAEVKRMEGELEDWRRRRTEADQTLAVANSHLALDGGSDPREVLARARVREEEAREERERLETEANAWVLLKTLFEEEQGRLSERFTAPLADRVRRYLGCIFGSEASAQVDLDENGFRLGFARPEQGRFEFGELSGGTREQVAIAFRLAMAEVLAGEVGGCLPVVLDDAFAHSDATRVASLQRMLRLAGERGLQVVVLTCAPRDYQALGGRMVMLGETPAEPEPEPAPELEAMEVAAPVAKPELPQPQEAATASAPPAESESAEAFWEILDEQGGEAHRETLALLLDWDPARFDALLTQLAESGQVEVSEQGEVKRTGGPPRVQGNLFGES